MNRKGQVSIGLLFAAMIGIIVGAVLLIQVSQDVGTTTNTITVAADAGLYTTPANGERIDLLGQDIIGTPVVTNRSGSLIITDANYTIDEIVSETTGVKTISYRTDDADYASSAVNITYTYGPDGYISSAGGRSMATIIPIFMALLIAVVALIPSLRSKVLDMVK